jgi:hypothetical protein
MLLLFLALTACVMPFFGSQPVTPTPTVPYTQCAYVEGRQSQTKLSARLVEKLKEAALPVETARAEAYGENCIAADGTVLSFSQRETDFYITLNTPNLTDQTALGSLLEKALAVIDQFPPNELGPNPGYIGITFQAGSQVQNLWFTQAAANSLRKQGLKGADLYRALANNP